MISTKRCTKCGITKPTTEFIKRKALVDGYKSNCRSCCNAARRTWYKRGGEKVKRTKEYIAQWKDENRNRTAAGDRLRRYGLTQERFDELTQQQHDCCAICAVSFSETQFVVDHDHSTGQVRGLLCHNCNHGLGKFAENIERLARAADYLLRYKSPDYVEVDERFTSQTCSECGSIAGPKGIAGLGIREWVCSDCGETHDRDVNAARNILSLALSAQRPVEGSQCNAFDMHDRI